MTASERAMAREEWEHMDAKDKRIRELEKALGRARVEWRFFWPHADGDMNGARWRTQRPSPEEIAEWRVDISTFWIERRVVYGGCPERVAFDENQDGGGA